MATDTHGSARALWPFVGRDAEVAALDAAVRRGRGATLTGEAGVGKSRLARTVLEHLGADGWATATFEAGPAAGAVPFLPFASLLRTPVQGDLESIVRATETLVASGDRVAVLIDDAHTLDDVSLAFVSHLITTTDVRVIVTVRTSDQATRLVRAWMDVLPRVDVTPLDRGAVDRLVRLVLGQTEPLAARWIWDTTAGNPLFVRELVNDAVERGALVERDERWRLTADSRPPGRRLRDVVVDRFGSLWDAERDAIELLAVAAPLGLRVFEKLASPEVVQELEHRGLISSDRSGRRVNVRLAHRIHGEVVREQLGPSTVDFHRRRLLEAMNSIGERRRSDRVRAALWRVELGDTSDPGGLLAAAEDLISLVDGASASFRTRPRDAGTSTGPELLAQAAQLTRAALDAGAGIPAAVLLTLVLTRLDRHDEARALRDSLDDLVVDETDRVLVARLLAEVDTHVLGHPAIAAVRLAELESLVTSPELVRSLRATRTTSLLAAGEPGQALALAREVLDDPETTPAEHIRCSAAAATAIAFRGRTDEALELIDRATELAAAAGVGRSAAAVIPRVVALASAGRFEQLEQLLTMCHALSEQHGLQDGVAVFAGALANAALLRGRPRTALTWTDTTLDHLGATEPFGVRRLALAVRAEARALLGDLDAASAAIAELDALGDVIGFEVEDARARAWVHAAHGRTVDAIGLLAADAESAAARGHVVGALAHLHDIARLGHADLVAVQVAELATGADGVLIPAQTARVAALVSDDADALERAGAAFADMGATLDGAEAYAQAAAAHRRAGRQGRSSAAAARSHELREQCEGAATPALAGVEPLLSLTRREREIALLASEGLSNREIADRLVVSVRTVHTHLYNAFAKLGVESRDALSAAIVPY